MRLKRMMDTVSFFRGKSSVFLYLHVIRQDVFHFSCLAEMIYQTDYKSIMDERNLHGYDIQTNLVFKRHDFVSHKVNPVVICEQ